jgi:hypothetical protein
MSFINHKIYDSPHKGTIINIRVKNIESYVNN